jgi:centrosomal protein CEP350
MISPSGGGQGDESFFGFLSRMVRQYVNEEEMRAKHQATLLKIRERAIKEKTKAELEWLKVKKKQLEKKQDDDAMPPLIKREQGALRKLKHEQAEIKRLREVQKRASQERKLMLLQQQDIARLQQSAQHYKEKIKRYSSQQRQTHSREESPIFEYSPSPSPVPSVNLEELSQDLTVSSQSIPTDIQPASSIEDNDDEMNEEDDRHSHNDSYKLRKLQQSSNATEK